MGDIVAYIALVIQGIREDRMKRIVCIAVAALLIAVGAFGQSAQRIDEILETQATTFGHAAYLILTAMGNISEEADFQEAFTEMKAYAEAQNFGNAAIRDSVTAEDSISTKNYAFLLMKAFNIKGGMMYRIYPCPRYAYRDLQYLAVIQGKTDPDAPITGTEMLQMLGRIEPWQGGEQ